VSVKVEKSSNHPFEPNAAVSIGKTCYHRRGTDLGVVRREAGLSCDVDRRPSASWRDGRNEVAGGEWNLLRTMRCHIRFERLRYSCSRKHQARTTGQAVRAIEIGEDDVMATKRGCPY